MVVLSVTLAVCAALGISDLYIRRDVARHKMIEAEKRKKIRDFYKREMENLGPLKLVGIDSDDNGDFDVAEAVKRAKLPDDVRIRIHE